MRFTVRLQSAVGTALDVIVTAYNEREATREALRRANEDRPGQSWLPIWVLS